MRREPSDNTRAFEIPISKLMLCYVEDRNYMIKKENECNSEEELRDLEDDIDYSYHMRRCEVSQVWLRAIGLSPYDKFIRTRLLEEKNSLKGLFLCKDWRKICSILWKIGLQKKC